MDTSFQTQSSSSSSQSDSDFSTISTFSSDHAPSMMTENDIFGTASQASSVESSVSSYFLPAEETSLVEIQLTSLSEKLTSLIHTSEEKRAGIRSRILNSDLGPQFLALEHKVIASEYIKSLEELHADVLKLKDTAAQEKEHRENEIKSQSEIFKEELFKEIVSLLETEFSCVICSEVMIKPSVLNCGHTFCWFCINHWMKEKKECPICRTTIKITTTSRHVEMDNFVTKIHSMLSQEIQDKRSELVSEREQTVRTAAAAAAAAAVESRAQQAEIDIRSLLSDEVDVLYTSFRLDNLSSSASSTETTIAMRYLESEFQNILHTRRPAPTWASILDRERHGNVPARPRSLGEAEQTALANSRTRILNERDELDDAFIEAAAEVLVATSASIENPASQNGVVNGSVAMDNNHHHHRCPFFAMGVIPHQHSGQQPVLNSTPAHSTTCPHSNSNGIQSRPPAIYAYSVPFGTHPCVYRPTTMNNNNNNFVSEPRRPQFMFADVVQVHGPPPAHQNIISNRQPFRYAYPQPLLPAHLGAQSQVYGANGNRMDLPFVSQPNGTLNSGPRGPSPSLSMVPPPPPPPNMYGYHPLQQYISRPTGSTATLTQSWAEGLRNTNTHATQFAQHTSAAAPTEGSSQVHNDYDAYVGNEMDFDDTGNDRRHRTDFDEEIETVEDLDEVQVIGQVSGTNAYWDHIAEIDNDFLESEVENVSNETAPEHYSDYPYPHPPRRLRRYRNPNFFRGNNSGNNGTFHPHSRQPRHSHRGHRRRGFHHT